MKTITAIIAALVVLGGGVILYNRYNTGTENDINVNLGDLPLVSPGTTTDDIVPGIDVDVATSGTSTATSTRPGTSTTSPRATTSTTSTRSNVNSPAISEELGY